MIEKIMKAVKSGNKKRGRNITVGAVVGFLLSCTFAMGADEYLWIKNDGGEIKYNTQYTSNNAGSGGNWNTAHPYGENEWQGNIYINNMVLSGTDNGKEANGVFSLGYGLRLSEDLSGKSFINHSSITGISTGSGRSCGIYNQGTISSITNNGSIIGLNISTGSGYGICNDGNITSITNNGSIVGSSHGIYSFYSSSGNRIETIENNGIISGKTAVYSQGNNSIGNIINDGLMIGGTGIETGGAIETLTNNSLIIGRTGIHRYYEILTITNIGSIIGETSSKATGINTVGDTRNGITNIGLLKGKSSNSDGYGFYNQYKTPNIINSGIIAGISTGTNKGYGIYNGTNSSTAGGEITLIANTGVIYGKTNAIKNADNSASGYTAGGVITTIDNYGILVTEGSEIISNDTYATITNTNHYGLQITNGGTVTTSHSGNTFRNNIIVGNDGTNELKRNMTVKNNTATNGTGSINGDENDSILNALKNTYEVTGTNKVTGSIINAYEEAVVFNTTDKLLTLSGTIVNGGVKDNTFAVKGSTGADTLILQAGDITYVGAGSAISQNTVISGNIDMGDGIDNLIITKGTAINGNTYMGAGDDIITIKGKSNINGILDGGIGDNDILNFGENGTASMALSDSDDKKINIMYDISDFETINVNSNVTLFEKTVGDGGGLKKLDISGVNEINISAGSVLNLRIDTTPAIDGRYDGHALFGNTALTINGDASKLGAGESITESDNGIYNVGVLNLVTNGLGKDSIIAMDGITLDEDLFTKTNSILDKAVVLKTDEGSGKVGDIRVEADKDIFREVKASSQKYEKLNDIYNGVISSTDDNFIALKNIITINSKTEDYTSVTDSEQLAKLLAYLGDIYTGNPYSYSSELSRKSAGMFRDIVTENEFRPNQDKWLIMGGLTHADGGTKDTYYGRNYHGFDTSTSDTSADMKLTGAYMLAKYGYSENLSLGLTLGGNKSEAEMSMSKVKGNSGYLGAFAENYRGNLTLKAGAGVQYSEYDADRRTMGGHSYSDKYSDITYDIYLNGRYSHNIGKDLFLEPYATLSYTYIDQDGANEGNKALAIETDSKSFDYTVGKVGVDLKKVIPHEKGKNTLSAGVSYTKILDGADEEYITGRFKGGSDFDILVAHKNEHSIGLNAKYALELENGVLFDVKETYSIERDSHNGSGKNKTKGEWIVGAGVGYKF